MKRLCNISLSLFVLAALAPAQAAVPQFMTYAGRLTDGTGAQQTLPGVTLTFRVYDAAEGGTPLWEQTITDVVLEDGYFTVMLGDGSGPDAQPLNITAVFAANDQTWLGITVEPPEGPDPLAELTPRQQIGSVPYAVRANRVEVAANGKRFSINAVFRGTTAGLGDQGSFVGGATPGRIEFPDGQGSTLVGYPAAKRACEVALGSPSAHMCDAREMLISAQLSLPLGAGTQIWYTSGILDSDIYHDDLSQPTPPIFYMTRRDCNGWTWGQNACPNPVNEHHHCWGPTWKRSTGQPDHDYCDLSLPVACCDYAD